MLKYNVDSAMKISNHLIKKFSKDLEVCIYKQITIIFVYL